jgi:electron transport complex protein RnfD
MMWTVILALVPLLVTALLRSGLEAFRLVVVAAAAALLTEIGARRLFGRQPTPQDGSALISAFLFALLLPPAAPSWMAALGAAFGILCGKEIFGGLGQNPFNPALVGHAFLLLASPFKRELFSGPSLVPDSFLGIFALLAGAAILFSARVVRWEVPLLYAGSVFGFSAALGFEAERSIFSAGILLAALFFVTDPATTPMTRAGERWFAVGSGLLTAFARPFAVPQTGATYALLAMNAMTPWLDHFLRPARSFGLQKKPGPIEGIKILRSTPVGHERGGRRSLRFFVGETLRWLAFAAFLALILYGLNRFYGATGG